LDDSAIKRNHKLEFPPFKVSLTFLALNERVEQQMGDCCVLTREIAMIDSYQKLALARTEIAKMKAEHPDIVPDFRRMAQETGLSMQSLETTWRCSPHIVGTAKRRKSKFEPYSDIIQEEAAKGPTLAAVFRRLQAQDTRNIFVSYDGFKSFVTSKGMTVGKKKQI
jgi:hypothetical protein